MLNILSSGDTSNIKLDVNDGKIAEATLINDHSQKYTPYYQPGNEMYTSLPQ